jgi:hypothetical protein
VIRHECVKLAVDREFRSKGIFCCLGTQNTNQAEKKRKDEQAGGIIKPPVQ